MYYAEYSDETGNYEIYSPDGDVICWAFCDEIEILLSHLNRDKS